MKAICADGTEVECGNFKAVNVGVVLTADEKRKTVIGFVPTANLSYILPDDAAARTAGKSDVATVPVVESTDDGAGPGDEVEAGEEHDDEGGRESAGAVDGADTVPGLVAGTPDSTTVVPDEDHRRLVGLGDTYVGRFREAGIETVSDLRRRSVDEVADAARAPRGRAERWLRLVTPRDDGADPSETDASESR